MTNTELADVLDKIQSTKNDGRGVKCVQIIIKMLRNNNFEDASLMAKYDQDKLRIYPDIDKICIENGLHTFRVIDINGDIQSKFNI